MKLSNTKPLASLPSVLLQFPGLNGDLVLKDISYKDDGLYQCTVANHVGSQRVCVVEVKVSGGCRQWLVGWGLDGRKLGCILESQQAQPYGSHLMHIAPAKVSQEALGETCKYEGLTCLSPYIPHCVSKDPGTPWITHPFSHRSPVLATQDQPSTCQAAESLTSLYFSPQTLGA